MMEKLSASEFDRNYEEICARVARAAERSGRKASEITLLAATKTVDVDTINYAIEKGITHIGENRVQEFLPKEEKIVPVRRHFIGHLQTNKVKDIVTKVELIHSVDSLRLAREIQKMAERFDTQMDVLLEVNVGGEESKSGLRPDEVEETLREMAQFSRVHVKGLMAIPPICDEPEQNRKYFQQMRNLFLDIGSKKIDNSSMEILSMGMSDDYEVAIEEGATLVRVGTALFGKRNYL